MLSSLYKTTVPICGWGEGGILLNNIVLNPVNGGKV